ncbi:MAG: serine/threonine-protein kinase [Pseudomonadota bacterium]
MEAGDPKAKGKLDRALVTGAGLAYLSDDPAPDPLLNQQISGYRITHLLAEGGMSRVYRAERTDGTFTRSVALKVSPQASYSTAVRQRFLREQRVLAGLNHPNIAQLFDASLTPDGMPYIVMELVDGAAIDEHCSEYKLGLSARLVLIRQLVTALAFAHSRLIVHRDIKPSNVMVGKDGRVRVLDFGIAKLLEEDSGTKSGVAPLTPSYASPEQLLGNAPGVGSDIFQVGLLLHELVAGTSLRTETSATEALERARYGMDYSIDSKVRQLLPAELVAIIEQCVRLDPDERYPSANALLSDLQAFSDGFPVQAAPQTLPYRLRKFVRRHAAESAIATVAVLSLTLGSVWYTYQLNGARLLAEQRADTSARVLQAMTSLVTDTFERLVDEQAEQQTGTALVARTVLEDVLTVLEPELTDGPSPDLLRLRSSVEAVLGNYEQAARSLEAAQAALTANADPEQLATVLLGRAYLLAKNGDARSALALLNDGVWESMLTNAPATLRAERFRTLAYAHREGGQYNTAIRDLESALDLIKQGAEGATGSELAAKLYAELAYVQTQRADWPAAFEAAEEALLRVRQLESENSYALIEPLRYSSFPLVQLGRFELAETRLQQAERIARVNFGDYHPEVAAVLNARGLLAYQRGEVRDAVKHLEAASNTLETLYGERHTHVIAAKSNLSLLLTDLGELDSAENLLQDAIAAAKLLNEPDRANTFSLNRNEGRRLRAAGAPMRARDAYEAALSDCRALLGNRATECANVQYDVASCLAEAGEPEQARTVYNSALSLFREQLGEQHPATEVMHNKGWLISSAEGQTDAALEQAQALLNLSSSPGLDTLERVNATLYVANAHLERAQPQRALRALEGIEPWAEVATSHPKARAYRTLKSESESKLGR